jgi:hypothetical protein
MQDITWREPSRNAGKSEHKMSQLYRTWLIIRITKPRTIERAAMVLQQNLAFTILNSTATTKYDSY